ncbi:MAG TPA: hypothetical protein DDW65_23965 [Firmicutes bacterium]|jgi:D-threonate/D-erythronate kinase|nr:hypothetical protein [Bacillota bacterium]
MTILIIADDLTGANDTNVQFVKYGASAITIYDPTIMSYGDFDVCSFSTESRSLSRENAYQAVNSVIKRLPIQPEDLIYKKVDSALRGCLGIEIDALADNFPWIKAVLVAPAYPDNHRTTSNGCQYINGVAVDQTEMAADPMTPVTDSNLLTILGSQSHRKIGYLPLNQVIKGYTAAQLYIRDLIHDNCRIIVADAETNQHLSTLAHVVWNEKNIIPCGSAGLALAFANIYNQYRSKGCRQRKSTYSSPFLAVVGSKSDIASLQIGAVRRGFPNIKMIPIDTGDLVDSARAESKINQVATSAIEIFKTEPILVLYLSSSEIHQSSEAPIIASGLGEIADRITRQTGLKTLFATGGDTAAHIFDKLGIQALELEKELEPGICKGKFVGGTYDGLSVITKAGSFGDELTLVRILKNVR